MGIANVIKATENQKKEIAISMRITEANKRFLEKLSKETKISQNRLMNLMLEEYQKDYQKIKED